MIHPRRRYIVFSALLFVVGGDITSIVIVIVIVIVMVMVMVMVIMMAVAWL